jgi:hypothetical protein
VEQVIRASAASAGGYRTDMPELVVHDRPIATVFDLLGRDENHMTASLGWGLAHNAALLGRFLERVAPDVLLAEPPTVELQKHDRSDGGFTDIELAAPEIHVIVEAKRGWEPPLEAQLIRYEKRFAKTRAPVQRFVVLTQNGADQVVRHRLRAWAPPQPVALVVLGWSDLVSMASSAGHDGPTAERHLAGELAAYLRGVADMRDTDTNEVHVVALTRKVWEGWPADLSPVDELEKHRLYHYPTVGNYRKIVPNYMGFRYDGRLQSIHHVDSYEIIDTPHGHIPGAPDLLGMRRSTCSTLVPLFVRTTRSRPARESGRAHRWSLISTCCSRRRRLSRRETQRRSEGRPEASLDTMTTS